jgi:hypothetical protein
MGFNSNVSSSECMIFMVFTTKPITSHNSQANAIFEQVHKVVDKMSRSFALEKEYLDEGNPFEYIL